MSLRPLSGFTLLELSIGLVVIGLVVGGILVGKDLIHAAELRATVSDINSLEAAIRTYQTKYNCLPGDCPNATDFFGTYSGCPNSPLLNGSPADGTCNGNGDGVYYPWVIGFASGGESSYASDQLILAQLVRHEVVSSPAAPTLIRPPTPSALATNYIFTNDLYSPSPGMDALYGRSGNTVTLGAQSGDCLNGVSIRTQDAQAIDVKIDDGHAASGAVFGFTGNQMGLFAPPACGPPDNSCLAAGDYDLSNQTALCRMIFYW